MTAKEWHEKVKKDQNRADIYRWITFFIGLLLGAVGIGTWIVKEFMAF